MEQFASEALWGVAIAVGLVAFLYLGTPLFIYSAQKFEAEPKVVPFDVETQKWPPAIQKLFKAARASLELDGFDLLTGIMLPSAAPNIKTVMLLFSNPQTRDGAMATAMYAVPFDPTGLQTLYVEYTCRFRNGQVVNTNNSSQLSGFPPRDHVVSSWLPTVRDPGELFRIHSAIADAQQSRSQKVLRHEEEFDGDVVEYIRKVAYRESFEDVVKTGWLFETSDGEYFRPTLKGAYLMTWRELWPLKIFRKKQRDRAEREVLERYG